MFSGKAVPRADALEETQQAANSPAANTAKSADIVLASHRTMPGTSSEMLYPTEAGISNCS